MKTSFNFRLSTLLFSVSILGMAFTGCKGNGKSDENAQEEKTDSTQLVVVDTNIFPPEAKISGLTYKNVKYNKENDTYSLEAEASFANVPSTPHATYKLVSIMDENNVMTSETGKFEGVKPIKGSEYYKLIVECENLDPVQTEIPSEVLPVIPKITKPSPKDIEAKLNDDNQPLLSNSEILNPECKFVFQNLKENVNIDNLARLYEGIEFDWNSVEVVSLDYDEFNRVNKMVLKINY